MSKSLSVHDQIRAFRGSVRLKPGEKSITQELLDDRAEDLRLGEAKWRRFEKSMQPKRKAGPTA